MGLCQSGKKQGGEIYQNVRVSDLQPHPNGGWRVILENGDSGEPEQPVRIEEIQAEHIVNAGGLWAREVGRMVGLELPVLAMEHMYFLTDKMPEVEAFDQQNGHELPGVVDFDGELYLRQEQMGMLMGTYEKACKPWSPKETPWDFGQDLLPPDLDRIAPSLEVGFQHFPAFENTGSYPAFDIITEPNRFVTNHIRIFRINDKSAQTQFPAVRFFL